MTPRPSKFKPGALVLIVWRDASALQGGYWHSTDTAKGWKPAKVRTVGFLVKHTRRRITVMQSFHAEGCGGVFTIPADWVTRITLLEAP